MRTTLRRSLIAVASTTALLLAGCGGDGGDPPAAAATQGASFPVTIETTAGPVTVEKKPTAIVSLSATATEMLYAIGAGDQVKAVDKYSDYPPGTPTTELTAFEPNVEAIIGMRPDLVVVSGDEGGLRKQLGQVSVPVLLLPAATSLDDTYAQLEQLGQATGHRRVASQQAGALERQVRRITAETPRAGRPVTYYHELTPDLYSATSSTFIGQVFGLLGMTSIADQAPGGTSDNGGFPQLSAEYVLKADPDFVFLADTVCCQQSAATVAKRPGWASLQAVRGGRVVPLNDDIASRWGPRVVELLEAAADALATLPE